MTDVAARARAWAAQDPDPRDRDEIEQLLAAGTGAARRELEDRFAGRLQFGTAGLRGAVGAGPNRMNRAVVRAATSALARWLSTKDPGSADRGVVVGCDARHRSSELADEATAVLAGAGVRVHRLEDRLPTPVLAFAVRHLGAAAGVMVTASHNPAADNGYKLYLGDGAQIVPPVDAEIERLIEGVEPLSGVPLGDLEGPSVLRHGSDVVEAYVAAVVASTPPAARPARSLSVVYTPLHGVAGRVFVEALLRAGHPPPSVVAAQAEPDPDFPTVAFPNPEEPGALDLAVADARRSGADLVLATDPDGDRLAVAVPEDPDRRRWRRLSGDEVGVLLGDFVIRCTRARDTADAGTGGRRVVAASIVSSTMLGKVAAQAGVTFVATLTGFKWIVRAPDAVGGARFLFGYEEALGYAVGETVRDKDGIGAALAVLALAGELETTGSNLLRRLDELAAEHGVHETSQRSVPTNDPSAIMARLRAAPPNAFGTTPVVRALDLAGGAVWQDGLPALAPADVLAYFLGSGDRVLVRPSGTEPKLKCYVEVVRRASDRGVGTARTEAALELAELDAAVAEVLAAPS